MATDRDFMRNALREAVAEQRRTARDLPHVGLGGPARSMYGERSTIGEAQQFAAAFERYASAAGARAREQVGPIKVDATAGPALGCEVKGCRIHGSE